MEHVLQLDEGLFRILNAELTASFLDFFMPFVTTKSNFTGVIIFVSLVIFILGKWKDKRVLIITVLLILISDLTAETLKHLTQRVRPCNELPDVRLLAGCTSSFSFPSGHATNIFAASVYLSYIYRRYAPVFLLLAVVIAYSRVYVGVHYPLDVLGGAFIGSAGAALFIGVDKKIAPQVYEWFRNRFLNAGS